MEDRVLKGGLWVYEDGYFKNDLIDSKQITFKGDSMIYGTDTFILKYEYFGEMKVGYPNSDKTTIYEPKGGAWW